MKVVLLSTYGAGGGAAIACKRLHRSLLSSGIDTDMLVRTGANPSERIYPVHSGIFSQPLFLWDKFGEKIRFLNSEKDKSVRFAFSSASTGTDLRKNTLIQSADIIHIHWVQHGYLSLENLKQLAALDKPVVWTLHDEWVFTGGCHYARGCRHYESECGNCPMLRQPSAKDLSHQLWLKKKDVFERFGRIHFVTCSDWLKEEAQKSLLLRNQRLSSVPNPIDLSIFFPQNKTEARSPWAISADRFVVLFAAQNIGDPRKGFQYLERALWLLPENIKSRMVLLLMGKQPGEPMPILPVESVFTGTLSRVDDIRNAYCAADVLVTPSLEDNLPNTIMEAMACGRPAIAFKTGGIPEMIDHAESGWLAEPGYEQGLTEGLMALSDIEYAESCGQRAYLKARALYAPEVVARAYLDLYENLIQS